MTTNQRPTWRRLPCCWLAALLVACLAMPAFAVTPTEAIQATAEVPEDTLLDVAVQILDPGLPAGDESALEDKGVFAEIRKSEARYIPVTLMDTLQATGHWGAVRVVPSGTDSTDLTLSGTIVTSSGLKLALALRAVDATGRVWLEKKYKHTADARAYRDDDLGRDPFQDLFNEVANDLLRARAKRTPEELREVRGVTELAFAADLAPDVFSDYLGADRRGRRKPKKLPAADDSMMVRIAQIRERDLMLVDTLTEHYTNFFAQMDEPYDSWRRFNYEEELARKKLQRNARMQKIFGIIGMLGGVLIEGNSRSTSAARQAAVIAGSMSLRAGMNKSQEAKLHIESLRELAASFDAEMAPMLVDIDGQTLRLTGSAEAQYITWRRLMRDFFVTETGLAVDPNTGIQVATEAATSASEN